MTRRRSGASSLGEAPVTRRRSDARKRTQTSHHTNDSDPAGEPSFSKDISVLTPRQSLTSMESCLPDWFLLVELREEMSDRVDINLVQRFSSSASGGNLRMQETRSSLNLRDSLGKEQRARFVMHPSSCARVVLDILSLVVLAYEVTTIPYFVAFEVPQAGSVLVLSCLSVAFWTFDIMLQFRTGFYDGGMLDMNPASIARKYTRGFFTVDITVLIVDASTLIVNHLESLRTNVDAVKLVRMAKVARLLRLVSVVRMHRLRGILSRLSMYHHSHALMLGIFMYDVSTFMLVIVSLNHFIACFWCYMGRDGFFLSASDTGYVWLDLDSSGVGGSYASYGNSYQYTTGLHWAVTQMTPGSMQVFPVNTLERIFNVVCLLFGLVVFSTLVSSLSGGVTQFKLQMQRHRSSMKNLNQFLTRFKVSAELCVQVCKLVDVKLQYQPPPSMKDVAPLLDKLHMSLRTRLHTELCQPLSAHPYFLFLNHGHSTAWEHVCRVCTDFCILGKGDALFSSGAEAAAMHVILNPGMSYTLDVVFTTGQEINTPLEVGVWLSEAALWCTWRHTGKAEVVGGSPCEVLSLNAVQVLTCLTKGALVTQLTKAYAQSFYHFLIHSKPPLFDWPNDLALSFGPDEVIAAMPKEAAVIFGQVAIEVMRNPSEGMLTGWLHSVRTDKAEQLIEEVNLGESTLLTTTGGSVVRCVPLVAIRLIRPDGRLLVQLRLVKGSRGKLEASCRLPGGKQKAGEYPLQCFRRLLEERIAPLKVGLRPVETLREMEWDNSQRYGVPTRYIRTVIEARWSEAADEALEQFIIVASEGISSQALAVMRRESFASSCSDESPRSQRVRWSRAQVFKFAEGHLFAWLSLDDFHRFQTPCSQGEFFQWLASHSNVHTRGNTFCGSESLHSLQVHAPAEPDVDEYEDEGGAHPDVGSPP